jgi:hypothetical protein
MFGGLRFVEEPGLGAIPAFRFHSWNAGVVEKLPAPEAPFGLCLSLTLVTDAKSLASVLIGGRIIWI